MQNRRKFAEQILQQKRFKRNREGDINYYLFNARILEHLQLAEKEKISH